MYHSITFSRLENGSWVDKNTFTDWHLVPQSRPSVSPPGQKTSYVDIPGGSGTIDLSEALSGEPLYNDRTGSWSFIVLNNRPCNRWNYCAYPIKSEDCYQKCPIYKPCNWTTLKDDISNWVHGYRVRVILDDDPGYFYEGRITVGEWTSDSAYSTITLNYTLSPYKLERFSSLENWKWDSFNFETGIIREYSDIPKWGENTVTISGVTYNVYHLAIPGSRKTVVPGFSYSLSGTADSFAAGVYVSKTVYSNPSDTDYPVPGTTSEELYRHIHMDTADKTYKDSNIVLSNDENLKTLVTIIAKKYTTNPPTVTIKADVRGGSL